MVVNYAGIFDDTDYEKEIQINLVSIFYSTAGVYLPTVGFPNASEVLSVANMNADAGLKQFFFLVDAKVISDT